MRFGITVPNFGPYGDPRVLADLARSAEAAGWDGVFVWDHVVWGPFPVTDPWVALAAMAVATERVRLGPMVTPLPRRRPVKLARETVALDQLSAGRFVLGVGIGGGDAEWAGLGEETDLRTRGAMLDEGLHVLTAIWSGQPVGHHGRHYVVDPRSEGAGGDGSPLPLLPTPIQTPRVPIWVAGFWPTKPPFRRAARWDGVFPLRDGLDFGETMPPAELREVIAYTAEHRTTDGPFDVVVAGRTPGEDQDRGATKAAAYRDAGATWWLEDVNPWAFGWQWEGDWPVGAMTERIAQGPPRG